MAKKPEIKVAWDVKDNIKLEAFLACPADEIFFGGAAGGGKSEGLLMSAVGRQEVGVFNNRNWNVLILRRTFPELERSIILRSQQLFSDKANYNGVSHKWKFPNGGIIEFGHIKNEDDKTKYQSAEYNMILFDELTHFTENMFRYMFSRLRTRDPNIKCKIKSASNPGGIGHGWVRKRYLGDEVSPREPFEIYSDKVEVPGVGMTDWTRVFIPANVFDNKILMASDPLYARRLMELPDVERRALLHGDWNIFSGQFFPEFSEEHVVPGFNIPIGWPVWISMDWGFATHCAVLFFTQDPETETVICFDEIYCSKKNPDVVSNMIKDKLGAHFSDLVGRFTDRRVLVKDEVEGGISTQDKFGYNGLYFKVVDVDRVNGWHRVRELLQRNNDGKLHFKIFKKCVNLIRTLPEMIFDMNNAEDMEHKPSQETHCPDALRYFAISRKHTDVGRSNDSQPMSYSSVTGYLGMQNQETALRHKIPRLTNATIGANYFFHRKLEREDE